MHDVREVEVLAARDQVHHLSLEDIDAHADVVRDRRFLVVVDDPRPVEPDHPELDRHLALERGDRRGGAARLVKAHELPEVERREEVSVHHEQPLGRIRERRERAGGAERRFLPQVLELDAEPLSVPEVRFDQLGEIAHREVDPLESRRREPPEQDLQHGHLPDRHQRLRENRRVRREPRAPASGEHDDVDRVVLRAQLWRLDLIPARMLRGTPVWEEPRAGAGPAPVPARALP